MSKKIKAENVSKIFGRNPKLALGKLKEGLTKEEVGEKTGQVVGVYNATFSVDEGEVFVIMGLSGSGKSTLIRCLNLLNKVTEGKIIIDGENIVEYDKKQLKKFRKEKISMVFQHFGLLTHRTVLKNVELGLELKGLPRNERTEAAMKSIETVGLKGWEEKYPNQLSGGMQQRVGLARALSTDPDILLMDEPFGALDPLIRREMQEELLELQEKLKKTIVFITHDVNEAFKLGDRVAVMRGGRIEQIDTPETILASPSNDYIREFVRDIDRAKVLQAKNAMFMPSALVTSKEGLKVAARLMRREGISSVFVVDKNKKLQGLVTIDDTVEAIKNQQTIEEIIIQDLYTTGPETYLQELIPEAAKTKYPLAVVDDNRKLLGIIARASVLTSLIQD